MISAINERFNLHKAQPQTMCKVSEHLKYWTSGLPEGVVRSAPPALTDSLVDMTVFGSVED